MSENAPVYGCDGCNTTGGRMSCPIHQATRLYGHRPNGTGWLGDSFGAESWTILARLADEDRNAAEARVEVLEERIRRALNELGIPQSGYPAPVANAVSILRGKE
jgi:hypothetical protein